MTRDCVSDIRNIIVQSRLNILRKAHEMGIYTWVSMEPVIIPDEALEVIRQAHDYVDFWKVGKLNHNKEVERNIDWPQFRDNATALLGSFGSKYYIKEDLRNAEFQSEIELSCRRTNLKKRSKTNNRKLLKGKV